MLGGANFYIRLTAGSDARFSSEREFRNFEVTAGRALDAVVLPGVCLAIYVLASLSAALTAYCIAFHS